jgi:mono/diheme cytochrome c family protein
VAAASEDSMKTTALLSLASALTVLGNAPAHSEETKSELVIAGHDFALKVCANCHVVAKDQDSVPILKPPAPSFSEIVAWPEATEASLRSFLSNPHGELRQNSKMPNFRLADFQINQILAYLLSLKGSQ